MGEVLRFRRAKSVCTCEFETREQAAAFFDMVIAIALANTSLDACIEARHAHRVVDVRIFDCETMVVEWLAWRAPEYGGRVIT